MSVVVLMHNLYAYSLKLNIGKPYRFLLTINVLFEWARFVAGSRRGVYAGN